LAASQDIGAPSKMQTQTSVPAIEPVIEDARFLDQVERHIALLCGQRFLRISLFRLEFVGVAAAEIGPRARRALRSFGLVGILPDGNLGLLYVGPRPAGQEDMDVERVVTDKLNHELARTAPSDARLLSVTASHRWADEINGAGELIDEAVFSAAMSASLMRKAS
jgi:hypothetical protein